MALHGVCLNLAHFQVVQERRRGDQKFVEIAITGAAHGMRMPKRTGMAIAKTPR